MKKTKYTEEQVIGAVKQLEAGRAAKEVAREMGVTDEISDFEQYTGCELKRKGCHLGS